NPFKPENDVSDNPIKGTLPLPSWSPKSFPSETVISTVRGLVRQYGGCSTYVPTYFARISGATCTSPCLSSDAFPTQCSSPLFPSLQTHSSISVSAANSALAETVNGFA